MRELSVAHHVNDYNNSTADVKPIESTPCSIGSCPKFAVEIFAEMPFRYRRTRLGYQDVRQRGKLTGRPFKS